MKGGPGRLSGSFGIGLMIQGQVGSQTEMKLPMLPPLLPLLE